MGGFLIFLVPLAVMAAAIAVRRRIARVLARHAAEDAVHGDVDRLPIGWTPDALRETSHGGEVGRG